MSKEHENMPPRIRRNYLPKSSPVGWDERSFTRRDDAIEGYVNNFSHPRRLSPSFLALHGSQALSSHFRPESLPCALACRHAIGSCGILGQIL
jgi:hypothetical protein